MQRPCAAPDARSVLSGLYAAPIPRASAVDPPQNVGVASAGSGTSKVLIMYPIVV